MQVQIHKHNRSFEIPNTQNQQFSSHTQNFQNQGFQNQQFPQNFNKKGPTFQYYGRGRSWFNSNWGNMKLPKQFQWI